MSEADQGTSPLGIRLFGTLEVQRDGRSLLPLRSRKGEWLLALLVLHHDRAVERDWLAGLLWPDSSEQQAAYNLRRNLTDLRQALGPDAARLQSPTFRTLRLDLASADVDLIAFDAAVVESDLASLDQAVVLHRGPLLEDCTEEWALAAREAREQDYLSALETLAGCAASDGDLATAEERLRQIVAIDPLRESAQRSLMHLLAARGQYAAAALIYRSLCRVLHRELNVEPDPETRAQFAQLRAEAKSLRAARAPVAISSPATRGADTRPLTPPHEASGPPVASSPPRHLPRPLSSLVGREAEVREIRARLTTTRLMTLTGTGGVGKTRLGIQVAEEVAEGYRDGAWFVDLAPLADPALVPEAVARALEVREASDAAPMMTLQQYLEPRQLLLVLDNCEHLIDACARLAETLLSCCAELTVLATSRQALGITGEVDWRVPSLALPSSRDEGPADLMHYASIRLFLERATAVAPEFALVEQNAGAVALICRRLDGIPLALELAAARVKMMGVDQLLARLEDRFRVLTSGSRTALPRQQTLLAAMDWSYDLLSEPERALLQHLSVFAGGFTLDAAETVCGGDVLDLLERLVDKSLVLLEAAGARYRLLETIRQYGHDKLERTADARGVRERHRDWCLALAEQGERELRGAEQARWLDRLEREQDNLRAALDGALERGEGDVSLRLAAALWRFWYMRGHVNEGHTALTRVLAISPVGDPWLPERARALHGTAILCHERSEFAAAQTYEEAALALWQHLGDRKALAESLDQLGHIVNAQNDHTRAKALFEESLALRRELGDKAGMAASLNALGYMALFFRDFERAEALCGESLRLRREIGDRWGMAYALEFLAQTAIEQERSEEAAALLDECLALRRQLGDARGIAAILGNLARVANARGDWDGARAACEESLAIWEELGNAQGIASSYQELGATAGFRGDLDGAKRFFQESLLAWQEIDQQSGIAECLDGLAMVASEMGQMERGIRLTGAADTAWNAIGAHRSAGAGARVEQRLAAAREALGEAAAAAAWEAGRALRLDEAIAEACR